MAIRIKNDSIKKASKEFFNIVQNKITGQKARGRFTRAVKSFLDREVDFAIGGSTQTGNTEVYLVVY